MFNLDILLKGKMVDINIDYITTKFSNLIWQTDAYGLNRCNVQLVVEAINANKFKTNSASGSARLARFILHTRSF